MHPLQCFLLSFGLLAHAQSQSVLGDLPLAVKTPYLHSWIQSNSLKAPEQVWPNLFTQNKVSRVLDDLLAE
jgi:hypothetical protein